MFLKLMFQIKFVRMRKGKSYMRKHQAIVKDYDKTKSKHLNRLATKMLKNDEMFEKLKDKKIDNNYLDLFN